MILASYEQYAEFGTLEMKKKGSGKYSFKGTGNSSAGDS